MFKVLLVAVCVTVVGLFVLTKIDPSNQSEEIPSYIDPSFGLDEDLKRVKISGEVVHPGDYEVSPMETLGDLISKAGGVTSEADPDSYTPTLLIENRTMFYISKKAELPPECIVTEIKKVNINTAYSEELKTCGFNSTQADNIVNYRKENGLFQALEDIMKVNGIGEKTYMSVRDKIKLS